MRRPVSSVPHPIRRAAALASQAAAAVAVLAALQAGAAHAEPARHAPAVPNALVDTAALERATPAQLQAAYLRCDRLASSSMLDAGTAAECGAVYEALKARVFGGDFQRLVDWWARQSRASEAVAAQSPDRR